MEALCSDTKAVGDAAAVAGGRSLPTAWLLQALGLRWPQRAKGNAAAAAAAVPRRRGRLSALCPALLPTPGLYVSTSFYTCSSTPVTFPSSVQQAVLAN